MALSIVFIELLTDVGDSSCHPRYLPSRIRLAPAHSLVDLRGGLQIYLRMSI